jgi:(p)ppGpp synthase/HD superfamily hydrolase
VGVCGVCHNSHILQGASDSKLLNHNGGLTLINIWVSVEKERGNTMNNQGMLFKPIEFANWAHRNQKRKIGVAPYIVHPFHTMLLLLLHGVRVNEPEGIIVLTASLLHDAPEDNPEEITFELIEKEFGSEVARIVKGVTLDPSNPDKRLSRQKILGADWMTRIVKVADVLSNTIGTTVAIEKLGLAEVQKHFTQPILERVQMEQEFMGRVCGFYEHIWLASIHETAVQALDELAIVARA